MTQPKQGYLRSLRQDAGLTQASLAAVLKTSPATLSAYETGARPVPPAIVALIEAACFPLFPAPAPSCNTPHPAPPGPDPDAVQSTPDWDAELAQVREHDAQTRPQNGRPQFEALEPPDDEPAPPPPEAAPYTRADLDRGATAYVASVGADTEMATYLQAVLEDFFMFLEREHALEQADARFHTACFALALTGDVAQYTTAVLAAQEAGLSPARIAECMRQAFRSLTEEHRATLLHEGNAPWLREQKKERTA